MTKHCGLGRLFAFLVAGLLSLAVAAPLSRADTWPPPNLIDPALLRIGDGVAGFCPQGSTGAAPITGPTAGNCWVYNGEQVNEITSNHLDVFYQSQGQHGDLDNPVLLILGVPREDLLFGTLFDPTPLDPLNPALTGTEISGATLYEPCCGPGGDTPIGSAFGSVPASYGLGAYVQGSAYTDADVDWLGNPVTGNASIYDFLFNGVIDDPTAQSNHFVNWQDADFQIPLDLFGITVPTVTAFNVYIWSLQTNQLSPDDAIDVLWENLPIGTFVVAFGLETEYVKACTVTGNTNTQRKCEDAGGQWIDTDEVDKTTAYSTPFTQSGIIMPPPELPPPPGVPEPTTLLLLGTGLLGIGRQWRKKQQDRKRAEKQSLT